MLSDGSLKCFGFGHQGQLAQGSDSNLGDEPGEMAALSPIHLGAGKTAVAVSVGSYHACAILSDGTLKCWGMNDYGQLGDDSFADRATPTPVSVGGAAELLAAGNSATCAYVAGGLLKCWGDNNGGYLGDGTTFARPFPTTIPWPST